MRAHLAAQNTDAVVFTSHHGICYYSGFLYCYFGHKYGHSFGVLKPGMVVSMKPMILISEGMPAAGGYREHGIFIITETGAQNITNFPYYAEEMIICR